MASITTHDIFNSKVGKGGIMEIISLCITCIVSLFQFDLSLKTFFTLCVLKRIITGQLEKLFCHALCVAYVCGRKMFNTTSKYFNNNFAALGPTYYRPNTLLSLPQRDDCRLATTKTTLE